jgi:integrase
MNETLKLFPEFKSHVGGLMKEFVTEKQACGYKYESEQYILHRLDQFIYDRGEDKLALPRTLVEDWLIKGKNESPRTNQIRVSVTSRFARFMQCRGCKAFVPDSRLTPMVHTSFTPYIFTHDQLRRMFKAADNLDYSPISPLRQRVIPEMFRSLYGCGLRSGEVRRLTLADVDLDQGILTIRDSKFHKDRLVPIAPELTVRLRRLQKELGHRISKAPFFPAPDDSPYCGSALYENFRTLLWKSGISHGGRDNGPRLHDLRHSFAYKQTT